MANLENIDNLCMNCFEELTNGNICEHCDYDNDTQVDITYLAPKTILNDKYIVGALISHESDCAIYMGYDAQLGEVVKIREFLPKNMANRLEGNLDLHIRERFRQSFDKYKASFVELWTKLVKLSSLSALIRAYDVFEANGTAYSISESVNAISLREFLLRNPNGNIEWDKARLMFMPVLTSLEKLHENGIIHGAICPDNLLLCPDGKMRIDNFSVRESITANTPLDFIENSGYTALEQYESNHKVGPATDIYSFGACIYRALVGQNPPDAKSRETNDKLMIPNTIAEKIPTHVIRALGGALQVYPEKRTKNIDSFREQLNAAPSVIAKNSNFKIDNQVPNQDEPYVDNLEKENKIHDYPGFEENKNNKSKVIILVLVVLIIIAALAGVFVAKSGILNTASKQETTTQTAATYTVPDFVSAGYTQSDIENNGAWNKQFKITFEGAYSVSTEEGIIFEQSVKKGEEVTQGTEIVLKVSKGVQTEEVADVNGMTLEEAKKVLTSQGFKVSTVEVYNDGSHEKDTVKESYGMAPEAGTTYAVGEEVILQVYGEVQTTTTTTTTESAD